MFSQWTSMLNLLERELKRNSVGYVRLDGSMTAKKRDANLEKFKTDPTCMVFIVSLKAGGVGLTITAASKVFLVDPWWNPATEDQAIDRIHRIGQKKNVEVIRFIVRDTVEEKMLELLQKKRDMIANALSGTERKKKTNDRERMELIFSQ